MVQAIVTGALIGALIGGGIRAAVEQPKEVYTFGDPAAITEAVDGGK